MDEISYYLNERREEVEAHLNLLAALERRSQSKQSDKDALNVDVRQVLILKASVLVHLYNVVEAVMAKLLTSIEDAVHKHHPKHYVEELYDRWMDSSLKISNEINVGNLKNRTKKIGMELLSKNNWSKIEIKKTDGNWDNTRIQGLNDKLGIRIEIPKNLKARVFRPYYNELSMMEYVRKRRNDLAHGLITFEQGADNKTHDELQEVADCIIQFMSLVVEGYTKFINEQNYLKASA